MTNKTSSIIMLDKMVYLHTTLCHCEQYLCNFQIYLLEGASVFVRASDGRRDDELAGNVAVSKLVCNVRLLLHFIDRIGYLQQCVLDKDSGGVLTYKFWFRHLSGVGKTPPFHIY